MSSSLEYTKEGTLKLPNIKKIFIPDTGKEIADADYSGADIQIVAADSGCRWLLDYFEKPLGDGKVYKYISSLYFQREITDAEYKVHKAVYHSSNYLVGLHKLMDMLGLPYNEVSGLRDFYFGLCPEIPKWQDDIRKTIAKQGYLTTIFGRRRWFLDRNDPMLANKATAFKPSSTIADLVNRGWVNIVERHPHIDVLLQTHDSLTCQYDISTSGESRKSIIDCMEIPLVFPATTITIPADLQVSRKSYGEVAKPESQSREFGIKDKRNKDKLNETK